jgi:hypothetical protein
MEGEVGKTQGGRERVGKRKERVKSVERGKQGTEEEVYGEGVEVEEGEGEEESKEEEKKEGERV